MNFGFFSRRRSPAPAQETQTTETRATSTSAAQAQETQSTEDRATSTEPSSFNAYVRYARGGKNPAPIECLPTDTVYELANKLKVNAEKFKLTADDIDESDIDIYTLSESGKKTTLHPRVKIASVSHDRLVFDTCNFDVQVAHVSQRSVQMFNCQNKHTVYDLMCKLRERLHEFGLPPLDVERVWLNEGRLQIYRKAKLLGGVNTPLSYSKNLNELKGEELLFDVISKTVDLEYVTKKCCGQNIVFFGGPSHGKSSLINTIVKSLQGFHQNLAQTFTNASAGTKVYTPYRIDVNNRNFTLWDVPGSSLSSKISRHNTDGRGIINKILDGRLPAHSSIEGPYRSSSAEIDRIHAAVCVQKGTAELERMHSMVFEATRRQGRSMPVFFIITHQDIMESSEVEDKISEVSKTFGVDRSAIFTISNYDHSAMYRDDPQRDEYVLSTLWQILSCAYTYKTRGRVRIGESLVDFDALPERVEESAQSTAQGQTNEDQHPYLYPEPGRRSPPRDTNFCAIS
ncbi:uncharacterized protein [Ptychodera flava]|uniref:uncharacterized protein n=1 Tax=Ptychodera flava TaxID=63121 RepID=UPI00396AAC05